MILLMEQLEMRYLIDTCQRLSDLQIERWKPMNLILVIAQLKILLHTGAREKITKSILTHVSDKLAELELGIEVVDVQIKRVAYNLQVQEKLFNRMISEQNMIAEKYRAQGQGKKQEILGKQIQKEKEIISNAYLKSQKIKGDADGAATKIYATAYNVDAEFYEFFKTLETYKNTLDPSTLFILSTDNKYLKYIEK